MYYFSYGSNMSKKRLQDRVPSAKLVGTCKLKSHTLKFHKASNDGSAKCDAEQTDNPDHIVYGVIFDIPDDDKHLLDRKEGLGMGYEEKNVSVEFQDGTIVNAFTYYATNIDPLSKPFDWYKEHVVRGARENNLPEDYIKDIQSTDAKKDTNEERYENELSIYRTQ